VRHSLRQSSLVSDFADEGASAHLIDFFL
jgi:hypothetical protein